VKYFGLIWRNAWRKRIRTSLTILSVLVAFLLFFLLTAIGQAMTGGGATIESARRLVVIDKVSLINLLPIAYQNRIEAIPGVEGVAHATWFGGYYQDPQNQFGQFPVDPEDYLALFPEFEMPEEQRQAFLANRTGAVVGRMLAERYGWQVGDRIPVFSTIWPKKDGSQS
jgi:putative ABC transport system permease protein